MAVAVHDRERFLFVDFAVTKRTHLKCVERHSFTLGEPGSMAKRRVQGWQGHAGSIDRFAIQSTIALGP